MMASWAFSPANCPRCDGPLRERGPNRKWLRYFECVQCWATFELVEEAHFEHCGHSKGRRFLRHTITLQSGRTRRGSR